MADWNNPTILSDYVDFVEEVKARDVDALTLLNSAALNIPTGAIKLVRTPVKFQEWDGSAFQDKILSVDGGGTGSGTASGARTALGLGTMAVQNANAVAITGGSIANLTSSGTFGHTGSTFSIASNISATPALNVQGMSGGVHTMHVEGHNTASQSYGIIISAGYNATDWALYIRNRAATTVGLRVDGNMVCYANNRLVIPVGTDLWAT